MEASPEDREKGQELFIEAVQEALSNGVRMENVQSATNRVKMVLTNAELSVNIEAGIYFFSPSLLVLSF